MTPSRTTNQTTFPYLPNASQSNERRRYTTQPASYTTIKITDLFLGTWGRYVAAAMDPDVAMRIKSASAAFETLKGVPTDWHLDRKAKGGIDMSLLLSFLLYGC